MPKSLSQFVFVDIETTGLDPSTDRITEIAAVSCSPNGDIQQSFSSLIYTAKRIPDEVQALTGITPALLSERGRALGGVMTRISEMLNGKELVAYNASFDHAFLKNEAMRSGLDIFPSTVTCALETARTAWPILKRHRLSDVAMYLGIPKPHHRAMSDCLAGMEVYIKARQAQPDEILLTTNLAITKLDIENALSCEDGEELELWTKPSFHSINAYRPDSKYGQGFVLGMNKSHTANTLIVQAINDGFAPYITVHHPKERSLKFTLHLYGR